MNDDLLNAVRGAVGEIFQSVVGSEVRFSPPVELELNTRRYETSVVISFVGGLSGAFALRCSGATAARIAFVYRSSSSRTWFSSFRSSTLTSCITCVSALE